MAQLTVIINDRPSRVHRIDTKIRIGRDAGNDVQILDQKVSRHHVSIERIRGFFLISDLGSRNGTFVNDVLIKETELHTGDRIRIGNTYMLFHDEPPIEMEAMLDTRENNLIPANDHSIELVFDYRTLKDQISRTTQVSERLILMDRMARLITFAANSRPLDSGQLWFQDIQEILHTSLTIDRSFVVLRNALTGDLRTEAVRSIHESIPSPNFLDPMFQRVFIEGLSIIMASSVSEKCLSDNRESASVLLNAMVAPMRSGSQIIGLLYVDSTALNTRFKENDLAFVSALANIAGTNLKSWMTVKDARTRSLSSWIMLSRLSDRDGDSGGASHPERMLRQTQKLCEMIGLSDDQMDGIMLAAVVSTLMEHYPDSTGERQISENDSDNQPGENRLLEWIASLPEMDPIVRLLRCRHENFDGSGIPARLSGNAIPLGSRIIRALTFLNDHPGDPAAGAAILKEVSGQVLDPMIVRIINQIAHDPGGSLFWSDQPQTNTQDTDAMSGSTSQEESE